MIAAGVGPVEFPVGFAVVMTAVTVFYVAYLVWKWRVIWERPSAAFEQPLAWWVWGDVLWRAYVRVLPVGAVVLAVLLVSVLGVIYGPGGELGVVIAVGVAVVTLAIWVVLMLSIALANRPRSLVPRHLRDEPGAVAEWRRAGSRRDPAGSR